MRIAIFLHPELTATLLPAGAAGSRTLGLLARTALSLIQGHGRDIVYAPVYLPDGRGCALSVRTSRNGIVVEIDPPGTTLTRNRVVRGRRKN